MLGLCKQIELLAVMPDDVVQLEPEQIKLLAVMPGDGDTWVRPRCPALGSVGCHSLAMARHPRRLLLLLPALQVPCTSDTALACHCGCLEQLEPEMIELLAAMAHVVQL